MRIGNVLILGLFVFSHALATEMPESPFSFDLYERLGLAKNATQEEITKRYRVLAKKYHPEAMGKEGDDSFAFVTQAYKVLKDPSKRAIYDRDGLNAFRDLQSTWSAKSGSKQDPSTAKPSSSYSRGNATEESYEGEKEKAERFADDLYDYFRKRHDGLSKNTDAETKGLLHKVFSTVGKYGIEKMRANPRFNELMELIYNDPVWKNSDPKLLRSFFEGDWFYSLRYRDRDLGSFLGKFDPNNPVIRDMIYYLNLPYDRFRRDFSEKRKRQGTIGKIIASMLREDPYRGTPAGEKLIQHAYQMWTELGLDYLGEIDRDEMTPKFLSLLDFPEWRNNSTLARIAKVPPKPSKYGKALEEYEELKKKYPDFFSSPTGARPAQTAPSASKPAWASAPASDQTAECMKSALNNFFDPFGFFKKH